MLPSQIIIIYCPDPCFFNFLHWCPFIYSIALWTQTFYQHFQILMSLYPQIFLSTVTNYATISNYNHQLPWSLFLQFSTLVPFHLCHCSMDTNFLSTFSNSDVSVPSNLFINSYQLCYHLKLQFLHWCSFIYAIALWIKSFYQHFQIMLLSQITIFLLPWSLFLQLCSSVPFDLCHCSMDTIFLSTFSNNAFSISSNYNHLLSLFLFLSFFLFFPFFF